MPLALKMARALETGGNLVAEAGTGTGKSLAYLVPSILFAESNPKSQVVISTRTIGLQDQLLNKDIPLVSEILQPTRSIFALKGRGNYLSIRRMKLAIEQPDLFHEVTTGITSSLKNINTWAGATNSGEKGELRFEVDDQAWELSRSDWQNCRHTKCRHHRDCHYFKAVRKAAEAGVLVVNHALFFSRLALSAKSPDLSWNFSAVILDESHEIENVATDQFSLTMSSRNLERILGRLEHHGAGGAKGILPMVGTRVAKAARLREAMLAAKDVNDRFFLEMDNWFSANRGRDRHAVVSEWPLNPIPLRDAISELSMAALDLLPEVPRTIRPELESISTRISDLSHELEQWFHHDQTGHAVWMEEKQSSRGFPYTEMKRVPLDVGPILREHLFKPGRSAILTSATMATDTGFEYFKAVVGLDESTPCEEILVGSPFHFDLQMRLELHDRFPDPAAMPTESWIAAIIPEIINQIDHTDGGILALFTNLQAMRLCHAGLVIPCRDRRRRLLVQGMGTIGGVVEDFRASNNGILLGVDSMWQGIDVRGNALARVIIPRLPFDSPHDPLSQVRSRHLMNYGGNFFADITLPRALLKFKQGCGRLIRSTNDHGTISILDPRIVTKRYGSRFLSCLPECPTFLNGQPFNRC